MQQAKEKNKQVAEPVPGRHQRRGHHPHLLLPLQRLRRRPLQLHQPLPAQDVLPHRLGHRHHPRPYQRFVTLGSSAHAPAQAQGQESQGGMRVNELGAGAAGSRTLPHPPPPSARDALLSDPGYSGSPLPALLAPRQRTGAQRGRSRGPQDAAGRPPQRQDPGQRAQEPSGKRSKSVTFCQPVAMVTPLPSGSEESVGGRGVAAEEGVGLGGGEVEGGGGGRGGGVPQRLAHVQPGGRQLRQPEQDRHPGPPAVPQPRPHHAHSPPPPPRRRRRLRLPPRQQPRLRRQPPAPSSGPGDLQLPAQVHVHLPLRGGYGRRWRRGRRRRRRAERLRRDALQPAPSSLALANGDTYAVVHKKPVPLPVFHPQRQNAQLYETGV